jgi:ATP-dependent exoDNAse (exonuclease V) alpha subunit
MTDKKNYEHAEKNAIVKNDAKVVDVTNLDKEAMDKLVKDNDPNNPTVFVGKTENLPTIGDGNVLKDIIGNIDNIRKNNVGAIVFEDEQIKTVIPKKKP